MISIVIAFLLLYGLFLVWYGGRGKPLSQAEVDQFLHQIESLAKAAPGHTVANEIRELVANDDGREFVMQNLVRYRAKALYPSGHSYDDDPRAADRRYGKAILWPLLRHGNMVVFVARRMSNFIQPDDADEWDYVAMVRYRNKRSFLRFALATAQHDVFMHKWAAVEKTQVFPVKPRVSFIFVRGVVAGLLALLGAGLYGIVY